jgi:hypothetical protein
MRKKFHEHMNALIRNITIMFFLSRFHKRKHCKLREKNEQKKTKEEAW